MCGILCLVQYGGRQVDQDIADSCLKTLIPRGPDRLLSRTMKINNCVEIFMGFTRLAIMDTSDEGQQPFVKNGNMTVCNGEIYNYEKIAADLDYKMKTNCDCEVLLELFESTKFKTCIKDKISGEFAVVYYDSKLERLYAVRDRYGVRPLYYGYNRSTQTIGFASELKALHSIMEHVEQVNPDKIYKLNLSANIISGITTDVSDLPIVSNYFRYKYTITNSSIETIHDKINTLFTAAVKNRLVSDRPMGFLLSGGLDSSLIVAIATKILGPDKIVCFSIGIDGSPDVVAAKKVVEFLGIKNHHIVPFDVVTGFEALPDVIRVVETYDITTIRASTPQYLMAKYISLNTDIKVLLSGEGSDEIHGSYRYFRDAPNSTQFHNESIRLLRELFYFDNKRTDRTMAAHGLEVRVPFLDFDYVNFIMGINPEFLMYTNKQMEKQIVRDSFKGYLPAEILYRSKEAFSDAVSNSETNWAQYIQEQVTHITNDTTYSFNTPKTSDAVYFRNIFNSIYPNRDHIIPHYWLPRFQSIPIFDPSATILKCY